MFIILIVFFVFALNKKLIQLFKKLSNMNTDDLSEASYLDLSNISAIPKSSSIRKMEKLNLQGPSSDVSLNSIRACSVNTIPISPLDKTAEKLAVCDKNIVDYTKFKIIYDSLLDLGLKHKHTLPETTYEKLNALITINEMQKFVHLPGVESDPMEKLTVLGISLDSPNQYKLDDAEKSNIKSGLETILREKINTFLTRYEQLGGNVEEVMKKEEFNARRKLDVCLKVQHLQWKIKMEKILENYQDQLTKHAELLNKWRELKNKDMNEISLNKANFLLLKSQVAGIQAKLTKITCSLKMFEEIPATVEAFEIVKKEIDDKLYKVMEEIDDKKRLKELYDQVKGPEYNKILEEYLQLCEAIDKKKKALKMITTSS